MKPDESASLDRLHDIVVPDPVSWWPLAIGWWVVFGLLLVVASYTVWRMLRNHRANAYRREALVLLEDAKSKADVLQVLRRAALVLESRETVAGLSNESWVSWLGGRFSGVIPDALVPDLAGSVYENENGDMKALRSFAEEWIRKHHD